MREKATIDLSALSGLGPDVLDPETRELLKQILRQQIEDRIKTFQKDEEQKKANIRAGIEMADAYNKGQRQTQARCSHEKPRGLGTRWVGFRTSTGQLLAMCLWCQKRYMTPPCPELGLEKIPREVLTRLDPDEIGGSV